MTIKLKNCGNAFFLSGKQGNADKDCKPVGRRQKRQASKQTRSQQAVKILNDEAHWQQLGEQKQNLEAKGIQPLSNEEITPYVERMSKQGYNNKQSIANFLNYYSVLE